ncbi:MAG TPA: trypsin-like peptidase domain-containing protein [Candidatus Obscuribacterales bacterium]
MRLQKNLALASLSCAAMLSVSLGLLPSMPAARAADAGGVLAALGPNTIADMAQAAAPAVVNIDVSESSAGQSFPGISGLPPGFEFFFNGQRMNPFGNGGGGGDRGVTPHGNEHKFEKRDTGSGFIVRPDGYIVTNFHVVRDADKIKVTLNDNRSFDGKVVGVDPFSDIAVVKINGENLPTLKMGTSSNLRPGEFAVAIGSPLGYDHTVTLGIISAVGRSVTDVNGNVNFIQTDAAINPGNSGGPLLNLNGEVIGVNTAIRRDAQNIGFSIPIDVAKSVSQDLIAYGKILRPWLGIQMHELDESTVKGLGLNPSTKGVAIMGFVEGSPAEAAGLENFDVIQKIDGKDMLTPKQVKEYVQAKKVSDTLNFVVLRKDGVKVVPVKAGNYADMMDTHKEALAPKPPRQE